MFGDPKEQDKVIFLRFTYVTMTWSVIKVVRQLLWKQRNILRSSLSS